MLGGPWRSGWSSGDDPPDPADPTGTSAVIGPDPATNPARAQQPSADERTGDPATLAAATQALRQHVDDRWVEMSDRVLSKALAATRRSLPVSAGAEREITVQYKEPVIPIADQIRNRSETVLQTLLGPGTPQVTVATMHVHVSDVTTDDPHTGRPPT